MIPAISSRFGIETILGTRRLDLNRFFDPVRSQYNANAMIQQLLQATEADGKIVGITELDLFIPVLSYIFGQAYLGGSVALVSSHRLENSRYGLVDDPALLYSRLLKCSIHELGHTFGLKHCLHPGCVMVSTTYVEEMDQKSDQFCHDCKIELKQRQA